MAVNSEVLTPAAFLTFLGYEQSGAGTSVDRRPSVWHPRSTVYWIFE